MYEIVEKLSNWFKKIKNEKWKYNIMNKDWKLITKL